MPLYPQDISSNSVYWTYTTAAAFTGSTYSNYASKIIPANTFQTGDIIRLDLGYWNNSSGSAADVLITLGGITFYSSTFSTQTSGAVAMYTIINSPSSQFSITGRLTTGVNLANDQTLLIQARQRTTNSTFNLYFANLLRFRS
jgi:hypothetical protein